MPTPSRLVFLLVGALVLLTFLHLRQGPGASPIPELTPQDHAGNRTLGFQQIFALSQRPSWRTRGLEAAANLTGIEIRIPPQPPVDDRLADAFANIQGDWWETQHPSPGASRAWLAHLDLLKHVYQSEIDTALIMEDDVDWDIALQSQMMNVSVAVRNLTRAPETDASPYGVEWDVLWLGHCGEQWAESIETVVFDDIHVVSHADYRGFWPDQVALLPESKRAVYWSSSPVCTFAYAVTHGGARKILESLGAGLGEAFDVELQHQCQSRRLTCVSVVPEVFRQYFPPAQFDVKSNVDVGNGKGEGPGDEVFESAMGSTENILHSARCHALWESDCHY
ncbi:hypothetical protein ASPCAL01055 [Aspergillus calidoustus]|uniref:Glycosyltransferase family 25 protein n=1 Tax=Aspergillus calidoustus TaxID=454130 RepID=A0A0U5FPS0_ASPCI|nr:hypothetical protein ASPCAL01055 [Aspergillus calidoustus]